MLNLGYQDLNFENESKYIREENSTYDRLLSRREAAKYIGFKPNTLAVWACNGRFDLKPIKIGRSVRYKKSVLDKFMEQSTIVE